MLLVAFAATALVVCPKLPSAQPHPSKPVKEVVGYSAGGAVDTAGRAVGQAMSVTMGQPFVVDNKPGGGTNIAVKSVIAAEPDGYTLCGRPMHWQPTWRCTSPPPLTPSAIWYRCR